MMDLEALQHLPKALLTKMFDTSCAIAKSHVEEHQQIDQEISDPSQKGRRDAILHHINREAMWQARIVAALGERRPALQRVMLDCILDD
jgi:predicted XRE-type DNA-binding protein